MPFGFLGCGHRLHISGMKLGTPKAMYLEGESFCVARGLTCCAWEQGRLSFKDNALQGMLAFLKLSTSD